MQDHSQVTGWEIVRKLEALHPGWTVDDHVRHLLEVEGRTVDPIWVTRWLRNIAAEQASTAPRPRRRS